MDWLSDRKRYKEIYESVLRTDKNDVKDLVERMKETGSSSINEIAGYVETVSEELRDNPDDLSSGKVIYSIDMLENICVWEPSKMNFDELVKMFKEFLKENY